MESLPKLSVIIPVYNAEKYLRKCLDSVICQSFEHLEIICVDDGSTDNSLEILREYQYKDSRIIILQQQNMHAGIARNKGLNTAKGNYIHFLDADDWLEPNSYNRWYELARERNADICACCYNQHDQVTGETIIRSLGFDDQYICETNFEKNARSLIYGKVVPWNKLYNRNFLITNKIYFDDLICANDRAFYFKVIFKAKLIITIRESWINYRFNNPGSLIGETRLKNFTCHFRSFESTWKLLASCDDEIKRMILNISINDFILFYRRSIGSDMEPIVFEQLSEYLKKLDMSYFGIKVYKYKWYQELLELTGYKGTPELAAIIELKQKKEELKEVCVQLKASKKEGKELQKDGKKLQREKDKLQARLDNVLKSKSYKVGRLVTAPGRVIRRILREK